MREFLVSHFGYYARKQRHTDVKVFTGIFYKPRLYFRMPKVASGTIADAVSGDTLVLPHCYRPERIRFLLNLSSSSFKFTFVRHPLSRFASAYKWLAKRDEREPLNRYDARQLNLLTQAGDINHFCHKLPALLRDRKVFLIHFYPQSDFIYSGGRLLVDYVGKYENFNEDCQRMHSQFGYKLDIAFGSNNKNKHKEKLEDPVRALIELGVDESGLRILRNLYARDFELFDYSDYG